MKKKKKTNTRPACFADAVNPVKTETKNIFYFFSSFLHGSKLNEPPCAFLFLGRRVKIINNGQTEYIYSQSRGIDCRVTESIQINWAVEYINCSGSCLAKEGIDYIFL